VIEKVLKKDHKIHAEMTVLNIVSKHRTVLNIVSKHRKPEAVFKNFDKKAGVCICCHALFEPLNKVALRYGLNLEELLEDLEDAVGE